MSVAKDHQDTSGNEHELDARELAAQKRRLSAATLRRDLLALPFASGPGVAALRAEIEKCLEAARQANEEDYVIVLEATSKLLTVLRYSSLPAAQTRQLQRIEASLAKDPLVRDVSPDRLSAAAATAYLCSITIRLLKDEPLRRVGRFIQCSACGLEFKSGARVCWTQRISHEEPGPFQHAACARKTRGARFARCFARYLFAVSKNPVFAKLLPADLYNKQGEVATQRLGSLTKRFEALLVSQGVVGSKTTNDPKTWVPTFVEKGLGALGVSETAAHDLLGSWRMRDMRSLKGPAPAIKRPAKRSRSTKSVPASRTRGAKKARKK